MDMMMASSELLVFFIWQEYMAQLRMYAVGFHFSGLLLIIVYERLYYLPCCNIMSVALTLILLNFLFISNLFFAHITKLQLLDW